jgi:hypothetical protein
MQDEQKNKHLVELRQAIDLLMEADDSSNLWLLQMMAAALSATAQGLIEGEQLMKITDEVEVVKNLPKGIERDLLFERTRKELKEMIGYIEV